MSTLIKDLKPGDNLLSLEMNRKLMCPLFEVCRVIRISEEKTGRVSDDKFTRIVELTVQDNSSGTYDITLEAATDLSIYDKVIYTTSPSAIYNEVAVQKQRAQSVLNNTKKYEACVVECESIMQQIQPREVQKPAEYGGYPKQEEVVSVIHSEIKNYFGPTQEKIDKLFDSLIGSSNGKE